MYPSRAQQIQLLSLEAILCNILANAKIEKVTAQNSDLGRSFSARVLQVVKQTPRKRKSHVLVDNEVRAQQKHEPSTRVILYNIIQDLGQDAAIKHIGSFLRDRCALWEKHSDNTARYSFLRTAEVLLDTALQIPEKLDNLRPHQAAHDLENNPWPIINANLSDVAPLIKEIETLLKLLEWQHYSADKLTQRTEPFKPAALAVPLNDDVIMPSISTSDAREKLLEYRQLCLYIEAILCEILSVQSPQQPCDSATPQALLCDATNSQALPCDAANPQTSLYRAGTVVAWQIECEQSTASTALPDEFNTHYILNKLLSVLPREQVKLAIGEFIRMHCPAHIPQHRKSVPGYEQASSQQIAMDLLGIFRWTPTYFAPMDENTPHALLDSTLRCKYETIDQHRQLIYTLYETLEVLGLHYPKNTLADRTRATPPGSFAQVASFFKRTRIDVSATATTVAMPPIPATDRFVLLDAMFLDKEARIYPKTRISNAQQISTRLEKTLFLILSSPTVPRSPIYVHETYANLSQLRSAITRDQSIIQVASFLEQILPDEDTHHKTAAFLLDLAAAVPDFSPKAKQAWLDDLFWKLAPKLESIDTLLELMMRAHQKITADLYPLQPVAINVMPSQKFFKPIPEPDVVASAEVTPPPVRGPWDDDARAKDTGWLHRKRRAEVRMGPTEGVLKPQPVMRSRVEQLIIAQGLTGSSTDTSSGNTGSLHNSPVSDKNNNAAMVFKK